MILWTLFLQSFKSKMKHYTKRGTFLEMIHCGSKNIGNSTVFDPYFESQVFPFQFKNFFHAFSKLIIDPFFILNKSLCFLQAQSFKFSQIFFSLLLHKLTTCKCNKLCIFLSKFCYLTLQAKVFFKVFFRIKNVQF